MYKLLENSFTNEINVVLFIETNTAIPFDPANTDYQAYLQWLSEGNTPTPADKPT